MRYLHLLVTVLLATPLAAQDLPAPGDYRQAVTRATGLYIDAMATGVDGHADVRYGGALTFRPPRAFRSH